MKIEFDVFLTHIRLYVNDELIEDLRIDDDDVSSNLRPSNLPEARLHGYSKADIVENVVENCLACYEEDLAYDTNGKMVCVYGEDFPEGGKEVDVSIFYQPLKQAILEFVELPEKEMEKKEQRG
ncbi:MAG: hypothetical protein IJS93_02510 [Clostridia bacterium]|nr:hypothetical protein [Clostridia bacterium]